MPPPDATALLFGSKPIPEQLKRRSVGVVDVPLTVDGLKLLAAAGNWSGVQALGQQLEQQHVDRATGKWNTEQLLQLTLVRVTAAMKMEQYSLANEIMSRHGDYSLTAPDAKLIPFSLRFMHAALPQYLNQPQLSVERLNALVAMIQAERDAAQSSDVTAEQTVLFAHRWRRLHRALAIAAFAQAEYALGMHHLEVLVDTACDTIEHALFLQQLGCAALRWGDLNAAQEAFKRVGPALAEEYDESPLAPETDEALEIISIINGALIDMFCGRANDALKRLHEVASPVLSLPAAAPSMASPVVGGLYSELLHANATAYRVGALPAVLVLRLLAVNTFIVCHQFATSSERCSVANSVVSFEAVLRRYPVEALRLQPLVQSLRRLYDWQGDSTVNRRASLEALVDAFVVGREAGPHCLRV